jgi:predicted nuclease of predicted toxin-antitoxin system
MLMKILLDECLPKRLKRALSGYDVQTVPEAGWAGKKNGVLLKLMVNEFDVFITVDQNMEYQQALEDLPIAFIVLVAHNNKLETLQPLMAQVLLLLDTIKPGQVIDVHETQ